MYYEEEAEYSSSPAETNVVYRTAFNTYTRQWVRIPVGTTTEQQTEDYYFSYSPKLTTNKIMAKVNFTKEHYAKMKELAFDMLVNNEVVNTKLGQPLTIVDLLHTQTINTLNNIRLAIGKQIEGIENQDEWTTSTYQQEKLEKLKQAKELVNLIIGWKRHNTELAEAKAKKAELTQQLKELKESQKSPEDKIKELEASLKELEEAEEF